MDATTVQPPPPPPPPPPQAMQEAQYHNQLTPEAVQGLVPPQERQSVEVTEVTTMSTETASFPVLRSDVGSPQAAIVPGMEATLPPRVVEPSMRSPPPAPQVLGEYAAMNDGGMDPSQTKPVHLIEDNYGLNGQDDWIKVEFVWLGGAQSQVMLCPSWSGWKPVPMALEPDGVWSAVVWCPCGKRTFKYLVDGVWCASSSHPVLVDGEGDRVNVREIQRPPPRERVELKAEGPPPSQHAKAAKRDRSRGRRRGRCCAS